MFEPVWLAKALLAWGQEAALLRCPCRACWGMQQLYAFLHPAGMWQQPTACFSFTDPVTILVLLQVPLVPHSMEAEPPWSNMADLGLMPSPPAYRQPHSAAGYARSESESPCISPVKAHDEAMQSQDIRRGPCWGSGARPGETVFTTGPVVHADQNAAGMGGTQVQQTGCAGAAPTIC